MSTLAFGARTPRDLLARASFEIDELEQAVEVHYLSEQVGRHKVGSLAATCAGTLWNLVDWLANTTDPPTRQAVTKAGFAGYEALRDHVKDSSEDLTLCWELTNGVKHCELSGYTLRSSQIDRAELSAPSRLPPETPISYRFTPKVKTKSGVNRAALDVYRGGLLYWQGFFAQLGL